MSWRDTIKKDVPASDSKGSWRDTIVQERITTSGPDVTHTESALRGAAQGASLGFADEITGAIQGVRDVVLTDAELGDLSERYATHRDESRRNYADAEAANPITYGAGNVAGGAATMFVPGLNVAKGATIANATLKGAALGMAGGAGSTKQSGIGALEDIALGGITGGALGAVGQKIGNSLSSAPSRVADTVNDFAEKRAFKALQPSLNLQRKAEAMGRVNSIGRELLDNKIISATDSVEDMIPKLKAAGLAKDQALGAVRDIVESTGAKTDMRPVMYDALWDGLDNKGMGTKAAQVARAYSREAENIMQVPERGINDIVALKGSLGEAANYNKLTGATPANEGAKKAYNAVRNLEDDLVRTAAPDKLDDYQLTRELSSHYKQALESANDAAARNSKNRSFGLTDTIAMAGQVAADGGVSGVAKGVAFGLANKAARERGNALLAVGADKLGDLIKRDPVAFGKYSSILSNAAARGGTSLSATHFLMQQRDPEYRETIQRIMNNEEAP